MQELEKILEEIDQEVEEYIEIAFGDEYNAGIKDMAEMAKKIIRKHLSREKAPETTRCSRDNDGWIPVEERSPAGYERIGYDKQGNKYMQRLEIAYMTDTIEYVHGYYDGYKWMDKRHDIIENVVAWKIHKPYRPERSRE